MPVLPLKSPAADPVQQARIHLAAAHRIAVLHDLEEGIDNHFTVTVPGRDDRYLILPFGLHWSEARASDLIVFDESGATLEGEGAVELSAQCIHAPIHRICGARVVMHTHQTWAVALNMLKNNRLLPASQTAAFFHGHIVLVTGDTVAQAYRRLYKLERVCRAQILAMSSGAPLEVLSDEIVTQVQSPPVNDRHSRSERERLFFEAMMRILDRENPGYAD
jgi:ribulose-5-phosphate 4-epimerase/fuculose-1-phosphate aldolase